MKGFLVVLLVLILASASFAEEKLKVKDVVITATKTEVEIEDVPASVTVITKEEIKAKGAERLKDIIDLNLSIYKLPFRTREGANLSIRGFDVKHTQILIDGKRVAGEVDGHYEIERITLENVERIEIIKGPASALYGSDAMGGVINIITKTPEKFSFELMPKYGAYGGKGEQTNISARLDSGKIGKFGFSLSGALLHKNPLFRENGTTTIGDAEHKTLSLKATYNITPKTRLMLDGGYMKEDAEELSLSRGVLQNNIHDNSRYDISLGISHKSTDMDYLFRVYGSRYDKDYELRDKTGATPNRLRNFTEAERGTYTAEGKFSKTILKNHLATIGGEFRRETFKGTRLATGKGSYSVTREGITLQGSEVEIDYYGVYIQDEWAITDKLLLIPAIRYDDSDMFEGEISPKLGLTYKFLPNLRLKLNYAHGYKTPTPNELYLDFSHPVGRWVYRILGNPKVGPEKANSYEAALESEVGVFSSRVAYFYNDVKDLIEPLRLTTCPPGTPAGWTCYQYQNIKKVEIQGLEVEAGVKPLKDFMLKAYYAYLDAKDKETGQRLENRVRNKVGAKLSYENKAVGFRTNLWWEYVDGLLWSTAPVVEKEYNLWYLSLSRDITKNFELYAGVDNLFDKKDNDIPIAGAFYYGGVRVKF